MGLFCIFVAPSLMKKAELIATLALPKLPQIGYITAKKLIRHFGSASTVFDEIPRTDKNKWVTLSRVFNRAEIDLVWEAAKKEVEHIEKKGINWVAYNQPEYPISLNQCPDAPLVLFSSGQPFPKTTRIISIVGTRQPSTRGREFVKQLVSELAPYQPVIVSGFAYGIDIEAQLAAIENNLITYGCFGHGILGCYPKEHRRYRKVIEQTGGFLTEFWANEPFRRTHFLQRNRIIAGLAQATLLVESRDKGGALTTAHYALGYQRDVFAVPGRPDDSTALGCLELIKKRQAECVTCGEDIAQLLGWKKQEHLPLHQPTLFVDLSEKEKRVLQQMDASPKHIDLIALDAHLKVSDVASLLFQMEMKGAVAAQAGKLFRSLL